MQSSDSSNEERSYDKEPYESYPVLQTHPARLAAIARIYGLETPAIDSARILELGCAAGGNLIPLAHQFPAAHYMGIDISGVQIEQGCKRIAQLGLQNIQLRKASISDVGPSDGVFDYIITHGVYSWVPPPVRSDILRIVRENLSPNGVAYISYNTLPGWHLKTIIRDIMKFHQAHMNNPPTMDSTRDLLSLIHQDMAKTYGQVVAEETLRALDSQDFFLKHDFLERWNIPCYFSEFLAEAKSQQLAYLSDADTYGTIAQRFNPENIRRLQETAQGDPLIFEQYLDFYTGRMFRMSLLIHEAQVQHTHYTPIPAAFDTLHFTCAPLNIKQNDEHELPLARVFADMELSRLHQSDQFTQFPIIARTIDFLLRASQNGHQTFTLAEISQSVCLQQPTPEEYLEVREVLIEMFQQRMLSIYSAPLSYISDPEPPCAFPLARIDAQQERTFTNNIFHQRINLNSLDHVLLPLLDGTRNRETLAALVEEQLTSAATLSPQPPPIDSPNNNETAPLVLAQIIARYVQLKLL